MIFKNILLAYQLEGYYNLRFLRFIYSHPKFWFFGSQRQTLDWTAKAKLIFLLSIFLFVLDALGVIFCAEIFSPLFYIFLPVCIALLPIYYIISSFILFPLDSFLKKRIIKKAKEKLKQFPDLVVIAITGSYGKTTTKEILHTTLAESFSVLSTQGTKNTPLGISRLILDELNNTHKIFIVEMGAYRKGNIAELCELVQPNISVITGITLQHLERFKSLDNIIDAKFEILECLGKDDFAVVESTTEGVQKGLKTKSLKVKNIVQISKNLPYNFRENFSGIDFDFHGEVVGTKLLSDYIGNTLQICYEIGKYLGQDMQAFRFGVSKIDFVEHRMQLIHNPQSNVYVLDDSFNGNLEGVESILTLLKNAPFHGRKIVVAGGVVELGEKSHEVNQQIGEKFASVSDMVLLVEGKVGNAIESGLKNKNFGNIKKYSSALKLHEDLKNIISSGDFVVFQNDLPDHYL